MTNRTDNFNRADNATVLGTPSDGGAAWGQPGGDPFGIIGNQAYTDGGTQRMGRLECSAADGTVQMTIATAGNGDVAVMARSSDASNFVSLQKSGSSLFLRKCVGGGFTNLGSHGASYASGDVIALVCSGTSLTAKLNGTTIIGPVTESHNSTVTQHGMITYGDTTSRIDDWSWVDESSAPSVSAPSAATVTAPGTANFGVTITGTSTGVQWQYSTDGGSTSAGSVVGGTGATTTSYTTGATAVSTGDHRNGYQYRAAVTWSGGTVFSAWAALTVNAAGTAPAFSVQPGNQTGTVGSTATFTFTVTGSGSLTVQAKKGGTNVGSPFAVTGGVSASYTTPTLLIGDNASSWTFEATGDTSPAATSSAATLTVLQPLATSITFTINGATSLTGLQYAVFENLTLATLVAPIAKGSNETTDGSDSCTVSIAGVTTKRIGDKALVLVSNSDGTDTGGSQAATRRFAHYIGVCA